MAIKETSPLAARVFSALCSCLLSHLRVGYAHKSAEESALSSGVLCNNGVPMAIPMGQRVPRITRGNSEPALTAGTRTYRREAAISGKKL